MRGCPSNTVCQTWKQAESLNDGASFLPVPRVSPRMRRRSKFASPSPLEPSSIRIFGIPDTGHSHFHRGFGLCTGLGVFDFTLPYAIERAPTRGAMPHGTVEGYRSTGGASGCSIRDALMGRQFRLSAISLKLGHNLLRTAASRTDGICPACG